MEEKEVMRRRDNLCIIALVLFIGICHIILSGTTPLFGDDIKYAAFWKYHGGDILYYPRWVATHFIFNNGRYPNLIAPVLLYFLPPWVARVLTAIMMMVWLYAMVRIICFKRNALLGSVTVIAIVVFTYTWWDSFTLYMVILNYIWAIATVLAFMYVLFDCELTGRLSRWLLYLLAVFAGISHEAAAMPIACGIVLYMLTSGSWRGLEGYRKVAIAVFIICAGAVTLTPGIILRFGKGGIADDTPVWLLLRSTPYCLLMLVMAAVCYKRLPALCRTTWVIYATASVVSAACVLMGGIVGRSGWFSQTYALIAMGMMLSGYNIRIPRRLSVAASVLMAVAIAVHYMVWIDWHLRLAKDANTVVDMYHRSDDGIVHYDYIRRGDVPWYLLRKVRGVPDPDDYYVIGTLCYGIGDSTKVLTVLPTDEAKYPGSGEMRIRGGLDIVTDALPAGVSDTVEGGFGRRTMMIDGDKYIVVPYRRDTLQLYYITPKDYEPADSRLKE